MRTTFLFLFFCLTANLTQAQPKFKTGSIELDGDLNQINLAANADFGKFRAELGVTYQIAGNRIDHFHTELHMEPAEIYYALEVSRVCHRPVDDVIEVYRTKHGKGWGKIAKELGIKPGSAEFHELKERVSQRSAGYRNHDDNDNENDQGKGKKNHGKGKGRNK